MPKIALLVGLLLIGLGAALVPLPGPGFLVLSAGVPISVVAGLLLLLDRRKGT